MKSVTLRTHKRCEFIDITEQVEKALRELKLERGVAMVFIPHTTAGITINENADPSVTADMLKTLAGLIPEQNNYRHAEGNSDAHCKASLMGSSVSISVQAGRLVLGTWQGVYFCEFDGPRTREFQVSAVSGG